MWIERKSHEIIAHFMQSIFSLLLSISLLLHFLFEELTGISSALLQLNGHIEHVVLSNNNHSKEN